MSKEMKEMFLMQDYLNTITICREWWNCDDIQFENAIIAESAELLDSIGFKWWKYTPVDEDNAKLEIVDLWHFTMSILMQRYGTAETTITELCDVCDAAFIQPKKKIDFDALLNDSITNYIIACLSLKSGNSTARDVVSRYAIMMSDAGMDKNELYTAYIVKNALNKLRRDNGYATGSYKKIWNGKEDNEVALAECKGLTYNEALAKLNKIYSTL